MKRIVLAMLTCAVLAVGCQQASAAGPVARSGFRTGFGHNFGFRGYNAGFYNRSFYANNFAYSYPVASYAAFSAPCYSYAAAPCCPVAVQTYVPTVSYTPVISYQAATYAAAPCCPMASYGVGAGYGCNAGFGGSYGAGAYGGALFRNHLGAGVGGY